MNKEDKIEQLIKNGLYDYEIEPTHEVWSRISSSLDNINKAQKRHILFKRISICSAAAILLFFALISIVPNRKIDNIAESANSVAASANNVAASASSIAASANNVVASASSVAASANNVTASASSVAASANNVAASASSVAASANNVTSSTTNSVEDLDNTDNKIIDNKKAISSVSNSSSETVTKDITEISENNFNTVMSANSKAVANNNINVTISNKKPTKLSAAILTNISGAGSDEAINSFRMSAPSYGGVEGHNNIVEKVSDVKYSLPISFGIQTQMNINDNVKVGIGINYTLLKSKYDCLINKKFHNIHQTIHYIGVPVNFYFNIANNNNFYVYANLGSSIEKGLRINYKYKSYDRTYHRGESVPGLQYSVNAGIGIEYILSKNIGIYIEPNAAYYFKSDIPASIRTDQPLQIKAELGVRYHFGR